MFTAFLIKYGEIGVKGKNRYIFEDALVQQIINAYEKADKKPEIKKPAHPTGGRYKRKN